MPQRNRWCRWIGHWPTLVFVLSPYGLTRHVRCGRCGASVGEDVVLWTGTRESEQPSVKG